MCPHAQGCCFRTVICLLYRTIVGTMDALVRLHETHTGGGESHSAPSTVLSPINVTTVMPNVPLLNTSNKIPIEKWVTTNPTQKPATSNSNTLPKQSQEAHTVTITKVVKDSTPAELKSTSNSILTSTLKYNANDVRNSVTTTPSLLEEVMALPDRSPNEKESIRSRNTGH